MTLDPSTTTQKVENHHDLLRVVAFAALAIALFMAFTALVGMQAAGPFYDIVPDPAGVSLPF